SHPIVMKTIVSGNISVIAFAKTQNRISSVLGSDDFLPAVIIGAAVGFVPKHFSFSRKVYHPIIAVDGSFSGNISVHTLNKSQHSKASVLGFRHGKGIVFFFAA